MSKKPTTTVKPGKPHGVRYPWQHWFAKRAVTLWRGTHYTCRTETMRQSAYQAARRLGVRVSVETDPEGGRLTIRKR